jgi:CRP/FNR family cyclic AMP-dependent transcriptional regulator
MKEKGEVEMTAESIAENAMHHPFLQGFSREQLTLLTDCALPAHFRAGEVIFREGEEANRFYLITSGKVVLESGVEYGEPVVIETIGAGDVLGWSWMLPPYRWHFTARTVEPAEAIFFAAPILHEYCDRDHSLGFELHKRMSAVMMKRLQAARKKMLAVHAHGEKLPPVPDLSPFMEQELDTPELPDAPD